MLSNETLILDCDVTIETEKYITQGHLKELCILIDKWMQRLTTSWTVGWEYYQFEGGFFIAPTSKEFFDVSISGNFFSQRVCRKTAGIIICLYALVELIYHTQAEELLDLYENIIHFSTQTKIADTIKNAID